VPAVTVNVAEVAPAATLTLAGTPAALAFELESDTTAPPEGAAAVNVTVPVPDCPLTIVLGLTATLLSAPGGGLMVTPNVSLTPEYDAVKVTDVGLVTVPALTVNVAEVAENTLLTIVGKMTYCDLKAKSPAKASHREFNSICFRRPGFAPPHCSCRRSERGLATVYEDLSSPITPLLTTNKSDCRSPTSAASA
jgi:hypothetical protein